MDPEEEAFCGQAAHLSCEYTCNAYSPFPLLYVTPRYSPLRLLNPKSFLDVRVYDLCHQQYFEQNATIALKNEQ